MLGTSDRKGTKFPKESESLDSDSDCPCDLDGVCTKQCECIGMCTKHQELFLHINERLTKRCFLTYSPKPDTLAACQFGHRSHLDDFLDFCKEYIDTKNILKAIVVFELTNKGQPHYHAYIQYDNKVTFIKQVVQPLYFEGNVLPIYNPPKNGIHYLFKTHLSMSEYLMSDSVIVFDRTKSDQKP